MAGMQKPTGKDEAVATMVCVTCGAEQFFADRVPERLVCDKCGGTVFREFDTPSANDQVAESTLEEQARSVSYGDASPGTATGDVLDLDMGQR